MYIFDYVYSCITPQVFQLPIPISPPKSTSWHLESRRCIWLARKKESESLREKGREKKPATQDHGCSAPGGTKIKITASAARTAQHPKYIAKTGVGWFRIFFWTKESPENPAYCPLTPWLSHPVPPLLLGDVAWQQHPSQSRSRIPTKTCIPTPYLESSTLFLNLHVKSFNIWGQFHFPAVLYSFGVKRWKTLGPSSLEEGWPSVTLASVSFPFRRSRCSVAKGSWKETKADNTTNNSVTEQSHKLSIVMAELRQDSQPGYQYIPVLDSKDSFNNSRVKWMGTWIDLTVSPGNIIKVILEFPENSQWQWSLRIFWSNLNILDSWKKRNCKSNPTVWWQIRPYNPWIAILSLTPSSVHSLGFLLPEAECLAPTFKRQDKITWILQKMSALGIFMIAIG